MPVPSPRNKILPARGDYIDLLSNVASILDGEICYAIDQDQYYQNEGGTLVAVGATKAQGTLADSATQPGDNVSTLTNDAGYITLAQVPADAVTSVAGKTGVVTLVKGDITDFSDADYATAAQGALADTALQPADIGVTVQGYDADNVVADVAPTFTATVQTTERTITAGAFDLSTGNHWTCGAITVPAPTNATAGTSGLIRITAGPVVWNAVFKFPGGSAPTISSFPAIIPFYVQNSTNILMGNVAEGIS